MVSRGSGFLGIKRAGGMSLITNSAIEVEDHEMRTMVNLAVIALITIVSGCTVTMAPWAELCRYDAAPGRNKDRNKGNPGC